VGGSFFEEDNNGLPNEGEEENINEEDMPPKLASKASVPKPAATSATAAAKPPPPAPACSLFTAYTYNFTEIYPVPEQQKYMIDLVVQLDGIKAPIVRVRNSTKLSVTTIHNKLAFVNLGDSLGLPETSARAAAFASIAQKLDKSKQYTNEDDGDTFTEEPQIITIPDNIKIKTNTPTIEHFPFPNGIGQDLGMKKHKQFSSLLIVQLEVDMPWVDHKKKTEKGESINLHGLSQSSEESLPPRRHTTKRGGGGGGDGGGGGYERKGYGGGGGKRMKLDCVEEDYEQDEGEYSSDAY
jgi:uncharacterized membrane protein YgcG